MNSKRKWLRLSLFALVGLLIGGGIVAGLLFFYERPEKILASAQRDYEAGVKALESKDASSAVTFLDRSLLKTRKVIDKLSKEKSKARNESAEKSKERDRLAGQTFYLQARALRDLAYARGLADGKPLRERLDSRTNQYYRTIISIPEAKQQEEARGGMRQASLLLSGEIDIQRECLRNEVIYPIIDWSFVEKLCQRILDLDPKDGRANYYLAWFHIDQPIMDPRRGQGGPTPDEKKSATRMLTAREHVDRMKTASDSPYWRTTDFDARITRWLRDDYLRRDKLKQREEEDKRLRALLLDPKTGVLVKAKEDKTLEKQTRFDVEAALRLHLQALDELLKEGRRQANAEALQAALTATLALCDRAAVENAPPQQLNEAARTATQALTRTRAALSEVKLETWDGWLEQARKLASRARERKAAQPGLFADLYRLAWNEAGLAARRGDKARQQALLKLADQALADGFQAGVEAGWSDEQLSELHALAADRKALSGAPPKDYAHHLAALRKSKLPAALAQVSFVEGVVAEREGRLERARQLLEEADPAGNDIRVHAALASVYLALGQWQKALPRLKRSREAHDALVFLSEAERAWVQEFLQPIPTIDRLLVVANLEAAREKMLRHLQSGSGQPIPADVYLAHEKEARKLIGGLANHKTEQRQARIALIRHFLLTNRLKEVRDELALARQDFPDALELLQIDVSLDLRKLRVGKDLDAKVLAAVDGKIKSFIQAHPTNHGARLFWVSWLRQTGRVDDAVAYLEDPANFPGEKDVAYKRTLAITLLAKGQREQGMELLRELPPSPEIDYQLILLANTPEEREKQLEKALSRHERHGLIRCQKAALAFEKKKYEEAAREYFAALEYTQVRRLAEQGLLVTLAAIVQKDPVAGQKLAAELIDQSPQQKTPYLAYAAAALMLDDLGLPGESWEKARNMSTALNVWERLFIQDRGDPGVAALTRSAFWRQAGRPDLAYAEVKQALKSQPNEPRYLIAAVQISLGSEEPAVRENGQADLAALEKLQPDSLAVAILKAATLDRAGKRDDALAVLEAFLKKNPRERGIFPPLLGRLLSAGKKERAAEVLRMWQELEPDNLGAVGAEVQLLAMNGQLQQAKALADRTASTYAQKVKDELAKQKRPLNVDEATWEKRKKERLESATHALALALAGSFTQAGALDEAEARLKALLRDKPDLAEARLNLSQLYIQAKKWQQARELCEAILKDDQHNGVVGNNLAWLLVKKFNDPQGARKLVDRFRKGRYSQKWLPGDRLRPEFLDTIGTVYTALNQPELYAQMKELFEPARRRFPSDPRIPLYLGHAYAGLKDIERARKAYADAILMAAPDAAVLTAEERAEVRKEAEAARKALPPARS